MSLESLLAKLSESYSPMERDQITAAYLFAEKAHASQKRVSGEAYITHCEAVASILAEMQVQAVVIAAALLHDVVEDTSISLDELRQVFGDETAKLVDGVTKLTNLPRVSKSDELMEKGARAQKGDSGNDQTAGKSRKSDLKSETLRKTFLAMGEDIRVVLIKLADRLHNMRTLSVMPEQARKRIARETMDIFAPLANRLGIWQMKWELEDLSFRYLDPQQYKEIAEKIASKRIDREQELNEIISKLRTMLENQGLKAEISGRSKHIHSIYRKMLEKEKPFENLMDLRGVRLIVPDIPSCYSTLGLVHTHWRPIPNEFDDYIAAPKDNFYQSIHTAVLYDDGKPLEIQIRTPQMHQNAEYGIAAHWRYKEKGPRDETYEQRINWLRKLMEWRQDVVDAQEFVEGMKSDVFEARSYVFTPKGDIIELPTGSTPIDFAYHVHTEIGNRCRGAKVNGKLVTLDYPLKTGDQVEILTAKQGGPSRDWLNPNLNLVKTQRARSKIRFWFKKQNRDQNLIQGRLMLERELKRLGILNVDYELLSSELDFKSVDELFVALGCGDLSIGRIINKIGDHAVQQEIVLIPKPLSEPTSSTTAVTVLGLKGLLTSFARCCHPAPGDEIVGYITRGRGATIHRQDCPNILRVKDKERIVRVSWGEPQQVYPIGVQIKAYDRQGLASDITNILTGEGINMVDFNAQVTHNLATITMVLEVKDIHQLSKVLTRIENLPNVMEAHRTNPG